MTTSILKMKMKSFCSEEITNPSATANSWDWVIEFLADLEHVDATFLDNLLSNIPHGYNSLSNNAKDKVMLKRLEKMIATPPRSAPTYAARKKMLARDFYDPFMSKRTQRKPHRWRPGTVAFRQYQKSSALLIPTAPFARLVREVTNQFSNEVNRWTAEALLAIQEAAEAHLVNFFEDSMLCAIHAKHVTLKHNHNHCEAHANQAPTQAAYRITNPSATANANSWGWVIEFLADLEHVDATFLDDLLSNVPIGYNSLSNNAKDKVVLKRLEKMIATPTTPCSALTHAARKKMLARDFYDRLMSKRGLDTSNFQDNVKVCKLCIRQFILQKRADLPKCVLPKEAGVLVACRQTSAKRPNVTGMNSANVKKSRFAYEGPTVYPVGSAINSSNHCARVNEFTPRVSEKLIENIQEAPFEDTIVSGKRKRNEFPKDQLIDLDDAETKLVEQNSNHLGLFTLEVPSGGNLSSNQDEATDLVKEHVVCKRMKKSMNDGQTEQCGSGITCNKNSIPQEVLFDGLHGKISVDESINGSGNQTNPETSTGNGEIFDKAHLSCANEVLKIATLNEQNFPVTLVQDSPETDSTKRRQCIRCQKSDQLLICYTCSLVIHKNCLGCPASFDGASNFICPDCLRFQARIALEEAKKRFELAKKKFELASDYLVFIDKELVHEKIVPSETMGGLNDSNMVVNGKSHDGIDANGKQKGIVKNQAIVAQVHHRHAEIGIVHDKTPQTVPCASPISGRDIASIAVGIQQKQVNNRVDGRVVKTQSSLKLSSGQGHGNLSEREKRTNIHMETSDASKLQQSVNAPKSASSHSSVIANIQYEGTNSVSSGEKHADVGKKNAEQELHVNAPNGPPPVLSNQDVRLAPDVCTEAVLIDQGLADIGAANAVEKQQAGTSPRRPSPPLEENIENKAENENGDGCFESKKRHSPVRRKSFQQSVILPSSHVSPSNGNVEEVSGSEKGDDSESESKKPARCDSKRTRTWRKKTFWTPEEEKTLKEGVHLYDRDGRNTPWRLILKDGQGVFKKCRMSNDLRYKWKNMLKSTGSKVV